ncbi:MAG: hypothetical protein U0168_18615 [Nannocystaceae bacterium]
MDAFLFSSSTPLELDVSGPLLGPCDDAERVDCSVEIEGNAVVVSSVVEVHRGSRLVRCKGERLPAEVSCGEINLGDGVWVFEYGDGSGSISIPSTAPRLVVKANAE